MRDNEFNRAQVTRYLVWTFGIAYAVQIGAAYLYRHGNRTAGQAVIALMMLVPALSVLPAGAKFRGMGWKPQVRGKLRTILTAWLAPMVLTVLGAALYFLVFPDHFDLSGKYLTASVGGKALEQLKEQGISVPMYTGISMIAGVTAAVPINALFALGEEIGWRGFLYPRLKAGFGRKQGWLLGGVIWGAWHWPLIWLIGYEYGAAAGNAAGYWGFPVTGMLLFCVFTAGLGILHDRLYEKSGTIWVPAIFHGAINAAATLPLSVCLPDTGSARLLGPAPMGILAGLPFLAAAAVLLLQKRSD